METTTFLVANACSYLGMIVALAGIKAKRETQKWCYLIGPFLLLIGASLFGNTVFVLLQVVIVLAGFGGVLNMRPALLSPLVLGAASGTLVALWNKGLIRPDWSVTGPVGLVLIALGVAFAPRPASNHLLFWAGVPLIVFSILTHAWPFLILNIVWSAVLLRTLTRPRS